MMELKANISNEDIQKIIQTEIHTAIARALTENPKELIEKVVNAALSVKKDSYSRESIFEAAIKSMIADAGKEAFQNWIKENRALIVSKVEAKIKSVDYAEKIAESIIAALADGHRFHISVSFPSADY